MKERKREREKERHMNLRREKCNNMHNINREIDAIAQNKKRQLGRDKRQGDNEKDRQSQRQTDIDRKVQRETTE